MKAMQQTSTGWSLPVLSTAEDVTNLDEQIKDDDNIKNLLKKRFLSQPHDNVKKFITENFQIIFRTDEISSNFSWTNTNKNILVKDMHFVRLLKVTLDTIHFTTTSTIEGHMKTFFNAAKDRLNKRNKRKLNFED